MSKRMLSMEEREKEAIDWTRFTIIVFRKKFMKLNSEILDALDNENTWDCTAMWDLKSVQDQIEDFLEDTDPTEDETYGVES